MGNIVKYSISKIGIISILIILITLITMSCVDKNPVAPTPPLPSNELVQGEIHVFAHISDLDAFVASYSEYDLKPLHSVFEYSSHDMTFNYKQTNGEELITKLNADERVIGARFNPGWIPGSLIARAYQNGYGDRYEHILHQYADIGFKIDAYTRAGFIRFSFDHHLIDEFDLIRALRNTDPWDGFPWITFNGPERVWISGTLLGSLHDNEFISFLESYEDYDIEIEITFEDLKMFNVKFDHTVIDEFELIEVFANDLRVRSIVFDVIYTVAG